MSDTVISNCLGQGTLKDIYLVVTEQDGGGGWGWGNQSQLRREEII